MKFDVIIIGTTHTLQKGDDSSIELADFMLKKCSDSNICGIAEELSSDQLKELKNNESVPLRVANQICLPYRACDPTRRQRAAAGILADDSIRLDFLKKCSKGSYEELTHEEKRSLSHILKDFNKIQDEKRERWWLKKLLKLNIWPILFVCGSKHVESFKNLIILEGHSAHIEAANWKPVRTNSK